MESQSTLSGAKGFTPGPWLWSGPTQREQARGEDRYYVHRVVGCGDVPPEKFFVTILSNGDAERDKADAQLVAAAPMLYDAAMSALAYLQTTDLGERGKTIVDELMTALTTAAE